MKTTNGHTNTDTMDDSDHICPLCCEEMDISDREFYPCKCGYQVCIWCWHKIRKSENGLCPACRTPYGEDPHQFTALDVEEVLRANKEAQAAAKREKQIQNQLLQQQQLQQQQQAQQHNSHSHNHNTHNIHSASNSAAGNTIPSSSATSHAISSSASLTSNLANSHDPSTSFDAATDTASSNNVDGPKDRSSLANLRVIRRNLIYAVGLPPNIANEETLRKPEYFGQYGKLTKVVVNRSSPGGDSNDPRRASSSAYITFQFKEDTLACIMALDGFHIDNRTIRASYGTSKYCSAFMKHVRCSNPDCTYLHEMGASEDTFTKQEIQAGYVTSGCDVLARQQQILVEQQRLSGGQAQLSATGTKLPTRKRTGGGGPSGTGKPHPNPIFPAPEFEEPIKQQGLTHIPSIPPPSAITKAATLGNPPKITMPQSYVNATNVPAKIGRTTSTGGLPTPSIGSTSTSPTIGSINPLRKTQSGIAITSLNAAPNPTTAASVVASSRRVGTSKDGTDAAQQHSTLTALTPLKRNTSTTKGKALPVVSEDEIISSSNKIPGVRNGKKASSSGGRAATINIPTSIGQHNKSNTSNAATSAISTLSDLQPSSDNNIIIGGDVIGPSTSSLNGWNSNKPLNFGDAVTNAISNANNTIGSGSSTSSLAELGGIPIPIPSKPSAAASTSTILGGDLYTGPLLNQSRDTSSIGGGGSSLLGGSLLNDIPLSSSNIVGGEIGLRGSNSSNFWSGSVIGGTTNNKPSGSSSSNTGVIGSHISSSSGLNSSSALASILGINLPTGSGSLQESLWSATPHQRSGPSPLSILNESTMHETQYNQSQQLNGGMGTQLRTAGGLQPPIQHSSMIGNQGQMRSSSSIGNAPIGSGPGTIGGASTSQMSNLNQQHQQQQQQSDIALLQILLPGVHITSDQNDNNGLRGGVPGWGSEPAVVGRHYGQQSIGSNRAGMVSSGNGNWIGGDGSNNNNKPMGGAVIGQPNYSHPQQQQQQNLNQGSGIW